jgi:hypothetical protein
VQGIQPTGVLGVDVLAPVMLLPPCLPSQQEVVEADAPVEATRALRERVDARDDALRREALPE